MAVRISLSACSLALLIACSSTSPNLEQAAGTDGGEPGTRPPETGDDGDGGAPPSVVGEGGAAADARALGAGDGGVGDDGDSAPPVGTNPGDGGAAGASKCGAPLDTPAPTATSIVNNGPYTVTSYSTGLPASPAYKSLTVYYPSSGAGPYVVVMMSPGLTEVLQYWLLWAQRFASYGYVAAFVEANDTNADSEATRADGLWAAIVSLKGENTRAGGPLVGKLSTCIVTAGHSLGGGASLTVANDHPGDVAGALAFNPYDPITTFSGIVAPTLVVTGQNDPTAPPAQHGRRQYDSMSASITKEYVEVAGGDHQAALFPATIPGQYAVSWLKVTVDGDARYRPFLAELASGVSDFATTLP